VGADLGPSPGKEETNATFATSLSFFVKQDSLFLNFSSMTIFYKILFWKKRKRILVWLCLVKTEPS
jgi:hypothetical protein